MIRERGNGLQVLIFGGRDPLTGKKRWISEQIPGTGRAAWRQARKREGELLAEVEAGRHRSAGSMRLAQLLDEWLTWRESNGKPISPSTLYNYRGTIETKIKPGLGRLKVTEIDARVLDRYYTALRQEGNARRGVAKQPVDLSSEAEETTGVREAASDADAPAAARQGTSTSTGKGRRRAGQTGAENAAEARTDATVAAPAAGRSRKPAASPSKHKGGPLSPSRIRDVHAILSGALGLAARWGMIGYNPAILAKPPAASRNSSRQLPTLAQAKEILVAASDDPRFELFIRISASTGLRRGEVCGLRWKEIDLDAGALTAPGNVLYLPEDHGGFVHKGPKSAHGDGRILALDAGTVELLHVHRALCEVSAEAAGTTLTDDAYVFSRQPNGARPIRPEAMTRRFGRLAKSLGHDYTLHGLRHFVATQLGMVAEANTIRTRMGHGSLAVSSIYIHPTAEADRAAADHMGKVLDE